MNLAKACQALSVSRSGYHAHLHKHQRPRRRQDAQLTNEIRAAFTASRSTYGAPRLVHCLRGKGLHHGKNRIARLMREQHLRVHQKRRFVPRTTVADKISPVAPNHLLQRPAPTRPNEVWVTDITYLPTREGWLYLAAEMDLCSRRILGWSTHESLATELPNQALERALQACGSSPGGLLHLPVPSGTALRAKAPPFGYLAPLGSATAAASIPAQTSADAWNCAASPPA